MDISKQQKKAIKKESGKAYHLEMTLLKRAADVKSIDDLKDKLNIEKLCNADNISEFEDYFNSLGV